MQVRTLAVLYSGDASLSRHQSVSYMPGVTPRSVSLDSEANMSLPSWS